MNHRFPSSSDQTEEGENGEFIVLKEKNLGSFSDDFDELCEEHAKKIFCKMRDDPNLMKDTSEAENHRSETLKSMPQCTYVKKKVVEKLRNHLNDYKSGYSTGKIDRMKVAIKMQNYIKNSTSNLEIANSTLKQVEGHFGSGTSSYFRFVKLLFLMNFFITVVSLLLIVLPQLVFGDQGKLKDDLKLFRFWDIFTGEGSADIFFSGYYSNRIFHLLGIPVNLMSVYFYTMLLLYIFPLTILGYGVAKSYQRSFIEKEIGVDDIFAHIILCGWDFSISRKETADLKSKAIYNELEELLSEFSDETDQEFRTRFKTSVIRISTNLFSLIILGIIAKFLYSLLELHEKNEIDSLLIPMLCILMKEILPVIFSALTRLENYRKLRHSIEITLLRTFLSGWVILGTLISFWLYRAKDETCWQTSLGREMYKLIIFDSISIILIFIVKISFFSFNKFYRNVTTEYEFNVASNTYDLIYTQSVFWMGFFFSPILPVFIILKLICTWYLKRYYLLHFCKPSTKPWRASRMQTYLLSFTFLTILVISGIMMFIYFEISPSSCGPFRNIKYFYEIIYISLEGTAFLPVKYLKYIFKPGVVSLMIIALFSRVYYLRERTKTRRGIVNALKNLLVWEAEDKKFLLDYIESITGNDFQWEMQQNRSEDPFLSMPVRKKHCKDNEESEESRNQ